MRTIVYLLLISILLMGCSPKKEVELPGIMNFENANSRDTYFTVHNIKEAWRYSKGAGVKVGIMDFNFAYEFHPELYTDGRSFQKGRLKEHFNTVPHHGHWMATTLREVAPDVEIYALGVISQDEKETTEAMIQAIEWAIVNDLDILTYSGARISEGNRTQINEALEKAYEHGIITTFIHYPHPKNLLPSKISPSIDGVESEPKVSIFKVKVKLTPY